jgi:hypothetical protein
MAAARLAQLALPAGISMCIMPIVVAPVGTLVFFALALYGVSPGAVALAIAYANLDTNILSRDWRWYIQCDAYSGICLFHPVVFRASLRSRRAYEGS